VVCGIRDHAETIRRLPAFTSKQASEAFGQNLEKLISYHRATGGLNRSGITAMAFADSTIHEGKTGGDRVARRRKSGVTKPLSKHLDDFAESLKAKGQHRSACRISQEPANKVIEGCGFQPLFIDFRQQGAFTHQ